MARRVMHAAAPGASEGQRGAEAAGLCEVDGARPESSSQGGARGE
ncbi:hypothetical protein [Paraburkholderia solitsugae]|nr:hypothetical protein [Paraburkholderia solitsugae]